MNQSSAKRTVQELKQELENAVFNLVENFEKETGYAVDVTCIQSQINGTKKTIALSVFISREK